MKKAKQEIELKFSKNPELWDSVLKSRQIFTKYLFDTYIVPDLEDQGDSFKETEKYKTYLSFIRDYQLYAKIKNNYIVKEVTNIPNSIAWEVQVKQDQHLKTLNY